MPAIPIIGAVAAVAGAGAAVVATVNQGQAQKSAEKNAQQAQEQADNQAKAQAAAQKAYQDSLGVGNGTQSTFDTSTLSPSPLSVSAQLDLAHSIQSLANATSEANLNSQVVAKGSQGIGQTQLLLLGGVALVVILILIMRKR